MTPEDVSYFMMRAELERKRAQACRDPAVAAAHHALAQRYMQAMHEAEPRHRGTAEPRHRGHVPEANSKTMTPTNS